MKLRNKLIPLMSVVTATTCVAPIATSCSNSKMVDIVKGYTPTIAKAKERISPMADADAQDLYFEQVKNNPEILKQDILKFEADRLPYRIKALQYPTTDTQEYVATNVVAKIGVNNISFKKVDAVVESKKTSFYALNIDLSYKFDYTLLNMDGDKEYRDSTTFSMSLRNIPTFVYSNTLWGKDPKTQTYKEFNRWYVSNDFTNADLFDAVPGWGYHFDKKQTVTTSTIDSLGHKTSSTSNYDKSGSITRKDQLNNLYMLDPNGTSYLNEFLHFESYHLSDVAAPDVVEDIIIDADEDTGYLNQDFNLYFTQSGERYYLQDWDNLTLITCTPDFYNDKLQNSKSFGMFLGISGVARSTFEKMDVIRNYYDSCKLGLGNSNNLPNGKFVYSDGDPIDSLQLWVDYPVLLQGKFSQHTYSNGEELLNHFTITDDYLDVDDQDLSGESIYWTGTQLDEFPFTIFSEGQYLTISLIAEDDTYITKSFEFRDPLKVMVTNTI